MNEQRSITLAEVKIMPRSGAIDPMKVRFSQNSIAAKFKNGDSVDDLVTGPKNGTIKANSIPASRVVEKNGLLYTLDNRRLYAFRQAGIQYDMKS